VFYKAPRGTEMLFIDEPILEAAGHERSEDEWTEEEMPKSD